MAKTSSVEKNNKRRKMVANAAAKRKALKTIIMDQSLPLEERFRAQLTRIEAASNFGDRKLVHNLAQCLR